MCQAKQFRKHSPHFFALAKPWLLLVCVVSAVVPTTVSSPEDNICEYQPGWQLYCNCDSFETGSAQLVSCFVLYPSNLTVQSAIWSRFAATQPNITSFHLTSRQNIKLPYFPTTLLGSDAFRSHLTKLTITEQKLSSLPSAALCRLDRLNRVNLESNQIVQLAADSFCQLPLLETLSLSENEIFAIGAQVFRDLPQLRQLFLDRNQVVRIDDGAFAALSGLTELDLHSNDLEAVKAETFAGLSQLSRLDLSRNLIRSLPSLAFRETTSLRELDLSHNQLGSIDRAAFGRLSHLRSVQLNNNQLISLPADVFAANTQLVLIDLSENQLAAVPDGLLAPLAHVNSEHFLIYFKSNPLVCTCDLLWLNAISRRVQSRVLREEITQAKCLMEPAFADAINAAAAHKAIQFETKESVIKLASMESIKKLCKPKTTTTARTTVRTTKTPKRGKSRPPTKPGRELEEEINKLDRLKQADLERGNKSQPVLKDAQPTGTAEGGLATRKKNAEIRKEADVEKDGNRIDRELRDEPGAAPGLAPALHFFALSVLLQAAFLRFRLLEFHF